MIRPRARSLYAALCALCLGGCSLAIDRSLEARDEGDAGSDATSPGPSFHCKLENDLDTGTRTFSITSLVVPESKAVGFDIDARASTTSADIAGCGRLDGFPGGIDNAFAEVLETYGGVLASVGVDVPAGVAASLTTDTLALEISQWNGFTTDPCMRVTIRGTSNGETFPVLEGSTALFDGHVRNMRFFGTLPITARVPRADAEPALLPLLVHDLRLQLAFSGTNGPMERIVVGTPAIPADSSMIGGYIVRDEVGFTSGIEAILADAAPNLVSPFRGVLDAARDLHGAPELESCSTTPGMTRTADSLSIGLLFTAERSD